MDNELQTALDDTLRKVGRNVLYFQRMEAMLKFLISRSQLQGTVETLKAERDKAIDEVSRQTMGNLAKSFFESVYGTYENQPVTNDSLESFWLSFSFRVEADPVEIEQRKSALALIVEERNQLIHQMLAKLNQNSLASCRELSTELDQQAERVKPEYERLRSLGISLNELQKQAFLEIEKETGRSLAGKSHI